MTIPRFHVPSVRPGIMELPESARVHATRVLRLGEGDALRVFDAGAEFGATIASVTKHAVSIDVGDAVSSLPERAVSLHLIMSPLKGDLTELVIQKATELGVSRISPVIFERTDTVARRDPTEARMDRWMRVAVSAAEQSGRTMVPHLDTVGTLREAVTSLGPRSEGELRIVATEPSIIGDAARVEGNPTSPRSVVVAVGPAGGLSPGDLETLTAVEFIAERFAVHTLRSETACMAAVAILGARFS